jgi:16S rRNA (adenine1518-N6/adenine1519-N6)-dimethyltransferase
MITPDKSHGQHYLTDDSILSKIVESLDLHATDNLLEVGPGPGYLTQRLANKVNIFHAIEIDHRFHSFLQPMQTKYPHLIVHYHDFLKLDLSDMTKCNKATGNLPYHLSMPIIERICTQISPTKCVFMLAEATAQRLMALPGQAHYSAASVFAKTFFHVSLVCKVSRHLFRPPPKIESIVCLFEKKDVNIDEMVQFTSFVRLLFSYRRKTLRNALKNSGFEEPSMHLNQRVEECSYEELLDLFHRYRKCNV